ncbi:alpha/beta family hydrolase [Piscinibacter sakaiensis]|uniref:alpha/beta hydrolase family protein n=1 Tax=Piscinibacter sakaiensis TaxID=1547922 RepID=UPI003AAA79F1
MEPKQAEPLSILVEPGLSVSALLLNPSAAKACFVFAHGAGAGMQHAFMQAFAIGLAERGIASLRYQFPFLERGSRRPDPPALAQATVRAAVAAAAEHCPDLPLIAGGKSFGGRMSSQAQAAEPLRSVSALAFVGFPLHPAGKPAIDRAQHLEHVQLPMLFLQGTRDELAHLELLQPVIDKLAPRATLVVVDDADHSFHIRARSGRTDAQAMAQMLDAFAEWAAGVTKET